MFALLLYAFDVEAYQEQQTHLGRIDTIFEDKDQFIIFELKFNKDPQVALDQIKERKYAENLKEKALKPLLVGVSFNYSKKFGVEIEYLTEQS
jgi:hypothetical protein